MSDNQDFRIPQAYDASGNLILVDSTCSEELIFIPPREIDNVIKILQHLIDLGADNENY